MKTGALLLCCLSLFLVLSSVTSVQDLFHLQDLRNTNFGRRYPRPGLMLLHWFAANINMDQNNVIQPLNFRPNQGDYGFHRYMNHPGPNGVRPLPLIPFNLNRVYYAFGNLNDPNVQNVLPRYVSQDFRNSPGYPLRNLDRIVIRVQSAYRSTVDEVYITQHYEDRNQGSGYDPDNTYWISPAILRQIQNLILLDLNVPHIDDLYSHARGLIPLMTEAGYDVNYRVNQFTHSGFCASGTNIYGQFRSLNPDSDCEPSHDIKLFVGSTSNGYTKISWSEVPENIVRKNSKVSLYKDDQPLTVQPMDGRTYGTIDTKTALNPGLQVKLLTANNDIIWEGPKFDDANGAIPTDISGYDASLQLFTKDGYASARLFIKKTFKDWKDKFYNSWVRFYHSEQSNSENKTWQWSVHFVMKANQNITEDYDIYEYQSSMAISPEVQARFLLDKGYTSEKARTDPWKA